MKPPGEGVDSCDCGVSFIWATFTRPDIGSVVYS